MKIYLDIGHGGQDSGAVDGKYIEKNLNLRFGLMVRDKFKALGQSVLCSRENDVNNFGTTADDAIIGSARKANEWGAELFLSLHFNSSDNRDASGAQFIYSVSDTEGKALCEAISKAYREAGQSTNAIYTRVGSNGLDYYGVIRLTDMQAIIIESAFITNETDIRKFENDDFCRGVADALCTAVYEFFKLNNQEEGEIVYYRVRKTWADVSSQLGAYTEFENAKRKADDNPGYSVFNEKGEKIYPNDNIYDALQKENEALKAKIDSAIKILQS